MNILHYFLGFPPYRTGGLTKYAFDLMCQQVEDGHDVSAMWPGTMGFVFKDKTSIKKRKSINGVKNFELINPLPVSLDEGITEVSMFTAPLSSSSSDVYKKFLLKSKPDVIHIHTLMGLHKEFVEAANSLGIRTIFTSHDYFGLCPKVTMFCNGDCCLGIGCDCASCNKSALSINKIRIMQSPLYRIMKNSFIVKILRKRHRQEFFDEGSEVTSSNEKGLISGAADDIKYVNLRAYYVSILESIDFIHYNSTVSKSVYERFITPKSSKVCSITHKGIADNRNFSSHAYDGTLRIALLAPAKPFKGYKVLTKALDSLWNDGFTDFELSMFNAIENKPYIRNLGDSYSQDELKKLFSKTDVLVAPSIWYETFGFTVLEALSFGVPVIVSDHVGAKDIINQGGIIVPAGDYEALAREIRNLNEVQISRLCNNVKKTTPIKTWTEFMAENYEMYGGIK